MAKSKQQKKQEAEFRNIRGTLVDLYRESYDTGCLIAVEYILNKKNNLSLLEEQIYTKSGAMDLAAKILENKNLFQAFPIELQVKGFSGWNIEKLEGLKHFQIEIQKKYLSEKMPQTKNLLNAKVRI